MHLKQQQMESRMFLAKYESQIYALLRVVTGFLFLCHGSQKLFGIPPSEHIAPLYITMIACPIEFFGGLMIMIGLQTSWIAFICS
jgi:putative oxidoreductase